MRGYDEDYLIKDNETGEVLQRGAWRSTSIINTADSENTDISELSCTTTDDNKVILAFNETTRKDNGSAAER